MAEVCSGKMGEGATMNFPEGVEKWKRREGEGKGKGEREREGVKA